MGRRSGRRRCPRRNRSRLACRGRTAHAGAALAEAEGEEYLLAVNQFLLNADERNSLRLQRPRAPVRATLCRVHRHPHAGGRFRGTTRARHWRCSSRPSSRRRRVRAATCATSPIEPRPSPRSRWATSSGACSSPARSMSSPSTLMVASAARLLSAAALLGRDEVASDAAAAGAEARLRKLPGTCAAADLATHRRSLLAGDLLRSIKRSFPGNFDPRDRLSAIALYVPAREAIDAGDGALAVEGVRLHSARHAAGAGGAGGHRGQRGAGREPLA